MFDKIVAKIRTVDEKDKLLSEIDILLAGLYENAGAGFNSTLAGKVRNWLFEVICDECPKDVDGAKKYLNELKDKINSLKSIGMTLAFEPTSISIDKFVTYIRENVSKDIILDILVDPSILGGVCLVNEGKYRDFSLKRLFEDEFEEKKQALIKEIYKKQ